VDKVTDDKPVSDQTSDGFVDDTCAEMQLSIFPLMCIAAAAFLGYLMAWIIYS